MPQNGGQNAVRCCKMARYAMEWGSKLPETETNAIR